jgi:hypothetical protein
MHTLCMPDDAADHVWPRVLQELARRKEKHLKPDDWPSMAKALGLSRQNTWNWKKRQSIPADRYIDVAEVLGWSVGRLMGLEVEARPTDAEPDAEPTLPSNDQTLLAAVKKVLTKSEQAGIMSRYYAAIASEYADSESQETDEQHPPSPSQPKPNEYKNPTQQTRKGRNAA